MKMRKFLRTACLIGLMSTLVFATACGKKTKPANANAPAMEKQKQTIEASGMVKADATKSIMLDFPATITTVHVKNGQKVKKGDPLFTLNLQDFEQQIQDKETSLSTESLELQKISKDVNDANKSYSSDVQSLQNNIQSGQSELQRLNKDLSKKQNELNTNSSAQIKQLMNTLKLAEDTYEKAKKDYAKSEALFKAGGLSKNDLDTSKLQLDDKQKQVQNAKFSLESAVDTKKDEIDRLQTSIADQNTKIRNWNLDLSSKKTTAQTDIEKQHQKIANLENEITRLKNKLQKPYIKGNTIVADVNFGAVSEVANNPGDVLQSNSKLLSLMDLNSLIVQAEVSEEFIKDVKIGAEVKILPIADSTKEYKGNVIRIADMGVEKNGETVVLVDISIGKKDNFLRPNFNVDVEITKK